MKTNIITANYYIKKSELFKFQFLVKKHNIYFLYNPLKVGEDKWLCDIGSESMESFNHFEKDFFQITIDNSNLKEDIPFKIKFMRPILSFKITFNEFKNNVSMWWKI